MTDQAGLVRTNAYDAMGRLTQVTEDPFANTACNGIASPSPHLNYATAYAYDALNDLTAVNQAGQTRIFAYDSLKHLTSAVNPESGTISYTYDNAGNLQTRTDNRGVATNYRYDVSYRLLQQSYSDGTPTVNYGYDAPGVTNSNGHLTSIANSSSTTRFSGFDNVGNVLSTQACNLRTDLHPHLRLQSRWCADEQDLPIRASDDKWL